MKFITEEDLRDLYRKQPFTDYDLQPGERLTPGARQYLVDKGINMYEKEEAFIKRLSQGSNAAATATAQEPCEAQAEAETATATVNVIAPTGERKKKKFCSRMKSLQSLFLLTAEEILEKDVCMSQQLISLNRQFASLGSASEGKCEVSDLYCKQCTGMNAENFSKCIGDCFEITEFHMQMQNGRTMLLLSRLRSELEEMDADLPDLLDGENLQNQVSEKLNQIINTLSQMICLSLGGKECQRKM